MTETRAVTTDRHRRWRHRKTCSRVRWLNWWRRQCLWCPTCSARPRSDQDSCCTDLRITDLPVQMQALYSYTEYDTHYNFVGSSTAAVCRVQTFPLRIIFRTKIIAQYYNKVKGQRCVWAIPSQSYEASLAIWDYTVLPATRHKWTRLALTPAASQAGTRLTYPGGMEGWIDQGSSIATRPGIEPTTAWSQVRRSNRYATKPHRHIRHIKLRLFFCFTIFFTK